MRARLPTLPTFDDLDPDETDRTEVGENAGPEVPVEKLVFDPAAAVDDPTSPGTFFLMAASAQTDKGLRRKRNEDSLLLLRDLDVYAVADGMGGERGGDVASQIAVEAVERAFRTGTFPGRPAHDLPSRGSELARAVHAANDAIRSRVMADPTLTGMGTTLCAARFARNKRRVYVAHVGDSRMYRLRGEELRRMTNDHTMAELGVEGASADKLSRALGVWASVKIDLIVGEPLPHDVYVLCSDGLTKMLSDVEIKEALTAEAPLEGLVDDLIQRANAKGGRDNISVIIMRVLENEPMSAEEATEGATIDDA